MKRVRLIIRGSVQGVGFRWFCQREAERLGVTGYARNMTDGSVVVEAQGEDGTLEEFEKLVARGPRRASVRSVERETNEQTREESGFETR